MSGRVVSDIQTRAEGESLYIRYNTDANVVNNLKNDSPYEFIGEVIAAVGSTLISTTDFDVMTRASFLDRVITMQLESKYRRNLDFCQSVIARKSP